MSALDTIRVALEAHGCRGRGSSWTCPAHDDRHPSLSVHEGSDGRVLITCHAGCTTDDVLHALGLATVDLFEPQASNGHGGRDIVATYPYVDERGDILFEAVRFFPKDFRQRRPDGNGGWIWNLQNTRRVLYRLPNVLDAVARSETIYIAEGEKDVHALESVGVVATTNPMGAGKWRDDYTETLAAADVVIVADRDDEGRKHARAVEASLRAIASSVRVVEPVAGKDVSDHLAAGRTLDELLALVDDVPSPPGSTSWTPIPLDWDALAASGLPQVRHIEEPYLPEAALVRIDGSAGSAKSIYLAWMLARLSRSGLSVACYSQENPLAEDVRRLDRLRPDWRYLRWFHPQFSPPVDLANPEHVEGVIARAKLDGSAVIAFDTETACWSGDENDNAAVAALERNALRPITRMGASVIVLGHMGHPQAFAQRKGVNAARGASSKAQKFDTVLVFTTVARSRFRIEHPKARIGGRTAEPATFDIIDTIDGGLDIVEVKTAGSDVDVETLEARALELVADKPKHYTKTALAQAIGGRREDALAVVGRLIAEVRLGPDKYRAKLSLAEGSDEGSDDGLF